MHHSHRTISAHRSQDSWRRNLDAAVLDYCAKHDVLPQDAVDAVSDFLRDGRVQRLTVSEARHRTRNEMQFLISSMRYRRRAKASGDSQSCNACMGQVVALAKLNDLLEGDAETSRIDLADQCRSLANSAPEAFGLAENVRIEVEAEPLLVPFDVARNVLLILNEGITNAIKHAFGDRGGCLNIALTRMPTGEAELSIMDDGDVSAAPGDGGLGCSLIDALASQIESRIERSRTGTGFRLSCVFPVN